MSDKWAEYKKRFCGCKDASRLNSCRGLANCSLSADHPERKPVTISETPMTNNRTIDGVSRKTIERIADHCKFWKDHAYIEAIGDIEPDLRALLDAPVVERCTSCDDSGDLIDLTGEWRGYCSCPIGEALKNKPVVERQPDAFRFKWDYDHGNGWSRGAIRYVETMEEVEHEDKSTWREITPLYAAPPEVAALQSTIAQLQARVAELEKDAARYQWLRDKSESCNQFYLSTPLYFTGVKFSKENVDRTIDACLDATAALNEPAK